MISMCDIVGSGDFGDGSEDVLATVRASSYKSGKNHRHFTFSLNTQVFPGMAVIDAKGRFLVEQVECDGTQVLVETIRV